MGAWLELGLEWDQEWGSSGPEHTGVGLELVGGPRGGWWWEWGLELGLTWSWGWRGPPLWDGVGHEVGLGVGLQWGFLELDLDLDLECGQVWVVEHLGAGVWLGVGAGVGPPRIGME